MLVGLSRPSVFMEGRAQVDAALLENTDKHGEADGPEKPKARRGLLCAGLVVAHLDSAPAGGRARVCNAVTLLPWFHQGAGLCFPPERFEA